MADFGVDLLHFRVPKPAQQIDYMHGVIEHRAAARQFGICKPAAGHRTVIGALYAVNVAQHARVELLFQLYHRRGGSAWERRSAVSCLSRGSGRSSSGQSLAVVAIGFSHKMARTRPAA